MLNGFRTVCSGSVPISISICMMLLIIETVSSSFIENLHFYKDAVVAQMV